MSLEALKILSDKDLSLMNLDNHVNEVKTKLWNISTYCNEHIKILHKAGAEFAKVTDLGWSFVHEGAPVVLAEEGSDLRITNEKKKGFSFKGVIGAIDFSESCYMNSMKDSSSYLIYRGEFVYLNDVILKGWLGNIKYWDHP